MDKIEIIDMEICESDCIDSHLSRVVLFWWESRPEAFELALLRLTSNSKTIHALKCAIIQLRLMEKMRPIRCFTFGSLEFEVRHNLYLFFGMICFICLPNLPGGWNFLEIVEIDTWLSWLSPHQLNMIEVCNINYYAIKMWTDEWEIHESATH